jgi:hypothetical protein
MNPSQLTFLPNPDQRLKGWLSPSLSYLDLLNIILGIVLAFHDRLKISKTQALIYDVIRILCLHRGDSFISTSPDVLSDSTLQLKQHLLL